MTLAIATSIRARACSIAAPPTNRPTLPSILFPRSAGSGTLATAAFGGATTTCDYPACTIVDVTTLNGVEGGDTDACVGTTLAPGATCNLKVSAGYTGAGGTLVNTCHANTGALTVTASVADQTGCAVDYYQAAGSTAADGVCTAW